MLVVVVLLANIRIRLSVRRLGVSVNGVAGSTREIRPNLNIKGCNFTGDVRQTTVCLGKLSFGREFLLKRQIPNPLRP